MVYVLMRRCTASFGFALLLFIWGGFYRWQVKGSPWPGTLEIPGWNTEAVQSLAKEIASFRGAQEELRRQLNQLPPEERSLFIGATSLNVQMTILTNPLIPKLVALRGSVLGPPPNPQELMQSIGEIWWYTAEVLNVLLWTLFVLLCLLAIYLASHSDQDQLDRLGKLLIKAPDFWLVFVFVVCVTLYGFTLESPWRQMPAGFFLVPALCLVVGFLLRTGHDAFLRIIKRIAIPWAVPAAGIGFTFIAGLLLELFAPAP